jgi:hypothetical protein
MKKIGRLALRDRSRRGNNSCSRVESEKTKWKLEPLDEEPLTDKCESRALSGASRGKDQRRVIDGSGGGRGHRHRPIPIIKSLRGAIISGRGSHQRGKPGARIAVLTESSAPSSAPSFQGRPASAKFRRPGRSIVFYLYRAN